MGLAAILGTMEEYQTEKRNGNMNTQDHQDNNSFNNRSRSRSPVRKSRSRSRSPRDRFRSERKRGDSMTTSKRVFVSNIHYDTRWMTLKDLFKTEVGDVAYVELYEDPSGKPTGSGIVEFKDVELANKAIETMHRFDFRGRKLVVREERESDRRRLQRMKDEAMMNKGMGGGSGGRSGGDMDMSRGNMGMMGNNDRGMGAGMMGGMVGNMGGGMGMGGMGGDSMAASNVNLPPGVTPQLLQQLGIEGPVTTQVFVANLDYKVTERKLQDIFKMAGKIEAHELKLDKDGKSRGMGTVRFETALEAMQAVSMFNGQILYERAMSVRIDKMADPAGSNPLPSKLPSGLKSIGMGLGMNGMPISNPTQMNMNSVNPMNLLGNLSGGGMGNMSGGMNLGGMAGGMGSGGMGNMGGMGSMNNMNSSMGNTAGGMPGMSGMLGNLNSSSSNSSSMGGMGLSSMSSGLGGMSSGMGGMGGMSSLSSSMGGNDSMSSMVGNRGDGILGQAGGMMSSSSMGGGMSGGMGSSMGGSSMGGMTMGGMNQGSSSSGGGMQEECCSVYVKNIPYNYTWQNLKERFRHIGEVRYAAIKTENGKSKGCGVVRFASMDHARMAIKDMNGARIDGRSIEVSLLNRGDRI